MSEQEFDIIFRGDIVIGHQLADVKLRLQQLFKADVAKVDALFSGRPVPLKRGLDQASAQKYREALLKAGAQVEIAAGGASVPIKTPASTVPLKGVTSGAVTDAVTSVTGTPETPAETIPVVAIWTLAPVGSYLLIKSEKAPLIQRSIDTSRLSLRAEGENLVDAKEKPVAHVTTVVVPDLVVAEVGANMVNPEEKMELPLLEIELEDWTLADLGADLVTAAEKTIAPAPVINIPDVGLAPVGSNLGQIKPKVDVVLPDISGLSLVE